MTSFPCTKCALWVGDNYEGNKNFLNHKCDPKRISLLSKARKELEKLDEEYWKKRREIESQLNES